jgi:hypothetical protein
MGHRGGSSGGMGEGSSQHPLTTWDIGVDLAVGRACTTQDIGMDLASNQTVGS